jgi:hypothetical protein
MVSWHLYQAHASAYIMRCTPEGVMASDACCAAPSVLLRNHPCVHHPCDDCTITCDSVRDVALHVQQAAKRVNVLCVFPGDVKPLVEQVLGGTSAAVMAYGQSGSGKTHTMEVGGRSSSRAASKSR